MFWSIWNDSPMWTIFGWYCRIFSETISPATSSMTPQGKSHDIIEQSLDPTRIPTRIPIKSHEIPLESH